MIVRAKYALIAPGEARRDVRIEIDGKRIALLHSGYLPYAQRPEYDLGCAVITPGLINCHTHLELEFCEGRIGPGPSFLEWLQNVRDMKASRGNLGTQNPVASLEALAASGCTTVLDHHTMELDWNSIGEKGLRYLAFREFFQFDNHDPDLAVLESQVHDSAAPHAPYTSSIEMARACRSIAERAMLPMSVHLAEIPIEIEFLRDGRSADIEALLRRAGAWDEDWKAPGVSPVRLYADNELLNRATYAIHMNYPQPGDIDLLADLQPTVVFCPATHAFFNHTPHPIADYLAAGIPVALGTDSLASNAALSPLREAGLVRQKYPMVRPSDVFAGITLNALKPLGWERRLGSLEPGREADFACFQLDGDPGEGLRGEELFDALFDAVIARGKASLTVAEGRIVHDRVPSGVGA